jgi:hypothetical protein
VSIAARAAAAHQLAQQQREYQSSRKDMDADIARVAGQLATLLGIGPHRVRADRSRSRLLLPLQPLTLRVLDLDARTPRGGVEYAFTYLDPSYDDESFFLLDPCPLCSALVPMAEIRTLADLGAFLSTGPEPLPDNGGTPPDSYPDAFDEHPAHTRSCPYRESQQVELMRSGRTSEALGLDPGRRTTVAERVEIPLEQRFPWLTGPSLTLLSRSG